MVKTEVEELLEEYEEEPYVMNFSETEVGFRIDLDRSKVEDVENLELMDNLRSLEVVSEVDTIVSGILIITD